MSAQTTSSLIFPSAIKLKLISHDVDEMREQSVLWPIEVKQLARGKFTGHILATHTKRLQLSMCYRSLGVLIRGTVPPDSTVISFPLFFDNEFYYRGHPLQKYQAITLHYTEELELHSPFSLMLLTIACNTALVDQKARSLTGKPFNSLRNQERLFMNPADYQNRTDHLVALLQSLFRRQAPLSDTEEKILENEILETIILGVKAPQRISKKPQRILLAQKAEEYIRSNLKKSLSISDLCQALGTSERTLHLGFKERFGIAPKAYSLIMRLNEVHKELRLNNSNWTVTDTAMKWGFFHLGRFSLQYGRMFGESPSNTRQKAQHIILQ